MKITQGKPDRALSLEDLPVKIINTLQENELDELFIAAIKTSLKPNPNVPILWAIITEHSLLLCSTNRPHGIWRDYKIEAINEVRHTSVISLNFIWNDIDQPDFHIHFPIGTDPKWVEDFVHRIDARKKMLLSQI